MERWLCGRVDRVILNGTDLSLPEILSTARSHPEIRITDDPIVRRRMQDCYKAMIRCIRRGTPVYGCNSSFGGQSCRLLNQGTSAQRVAEARRLSESLTFLDITVGPPLEPGLVRAAMLIRMNMLLRGLSAVRIGTVEAIGKLLVHGLTPVVGSFGSLGASGDLALNQRVVATLRGLPSARVVDAEGHAISAADALARHGLKPLELSPKEGLALVNGDNFSTAAAVLAGHRVLQCFLIGMAAGALTIEALRGTTRSFHPMLAAVRPHQGQTEVAGLYRGLLAGSQLARQELAGHSKRSRGEKVQDGYSLRCLAQFEGVLAERLQSALATVSVNANTASDNPLWVPPELAQPGEEPWQWVSGGNFLAMHVAEALDDLRKITTQMLKRNDRHLARLIDTADNCGLPPNLSDPAHSTTGCAFKGAQILSGMLEVHSVLLANPVTTLFGVHEERNQDLTSHAMTSGLLALQNLQLLQYSLAVNLLAAAQAVDLRGGSELLSPRTRPLHQYVRSLSPRVTVERPLHEDLERVAATISSGEMLEELREPLFGGLLEENDRHRASDPLQATVDLSSGRRSGRSDSAPLCGGISRNGF
jgi:histidine ammonia-lyase